MKTEALISSLSENTAPKKPVRFIRVFSEWFFITFLSLLLVTFLFDVREDITTRLHSSAFIYELIANSVLLLISGFSAVSLAYPQKIGKFLVTILSLSVGLYAATILYTILTDTPDLSTVHAHGFECLSCILAFALVPVIFTCWRLKQLATTHPDALGAISFLMAMSCGTLGVLLVESETTTKGLFLWHYLPLLSFSIMGYLAGKKIFKW